MIAPDGTEKLLYTLSEGWFYGETPCVLDDATGLYSKTERAGLTRSASFLDDKPIFLVSLYSLFVKSLMPFCQHVV